MRCGNGCSQRLATPKESVPVNLPPARILGIDHVGIAVADLDAALAFYRDVLGLEPPQAARLPAPATPAAASPEYRST